MEIAVPLVYALLPSKTQASYVTLLEEVKNAMTRHRIQLVPPERVLQDFEISIKNAVLSVFPGWVIQYCFFHLGQSVYRRVQSEGLQELYNNPQDRALKEATHMLLSLAFVPLDDVVAAFDELYDSLPDDLVPVATYFEENYIVGRRARGRRRSTAARFPPKLWNAYEATIHNSHRTNNISEGWHNKFRLVVGKHHPSLFGGLEEFRKEQADTETILAQMELGQSVKAAPKKKWLRLHKNIRNVVGQYEGYKAQGDVVSYLRTLGHHFVL